MVNRLVKRGGVVVKVWLKTTANRHPTMQVFAHSQIFWKTDAKLIKRQRPAGKVNTLETIRLHQQSHSIKWLRWRVFSCRFPAQCGI